MKLITFWEDRMSRNIIDLKTINDLLKEKYEFFIPSYQRGYRWTKQQVTDLLSDIWEFHESDPKKEEFYCLQPIVLKKNLIGGKELWEVIDGQQRLTTIYIILSYIKTILPTVELTFTLEYETRAKSKDFLNNIDVDLKDQNIDFFHIYSAYQYVGEWFESKENKLNAVISLYSRLSEQTKVIWYQVEDADVIDIFTRINLGKIPLTNAELIKALLLKKDNFGVDDTEKIRLKQIEIASEWDRIEYSLRNDEFWYFLSEGTIAYETRIEFIFYLMANRINKDLPEQKKIDKSNEFYSFLVFNQLFKREEGDQQSKQLVIERLWLKIKRFFMIFEEWFTDRELYHLIGYLVSTKVKIDDIKNDTENMTKDELRIYLKSRIKKTLVSKEKLESLNYENDKALIKRVLLLFNVISLQSNIKSNVRFPFDRYKKENWDIEHIHAVQTKMPYDAKNRIDFINALQKEIDDPETIEKINDFLTRNEISDDEDFEDLYTFVLNKFGEMDNVHDISNLTLLDSGTNRSYQNAIFPIKRKVILRSDMRGTFIPLCTKNVFLKYYSEDIAQMNYWGKMDRQKYIEAIIEMLAEYLPN